MRKTVAVVTLAFVVAGCEPTISNWTPPMEPTRESVAAPRRELTQAEKDAIAEAVTLKLGDAPHAELPYWVPLIVRPHDHVIDYCGLINPNQTTDDRTDPKNQRKYYAWLSFDGRGKLTNVDVRSIARYQAVNPPTEVDSICMQDGYGLWR